MTLIEGAKVRITNIMGFTEDSTIEQGFQIIGQDGTIQRVHHTGWVSVLLPNNLAYSTGDGVLLRPSEIELA